MGAASTVRNTILEQDLIAPGDFVVLGLSGGADSLCLLYILLELREELSFDVSCVHVNHKMRGEQAEEDVRWLTACCRTLGVPLAVFECDVRGEAKRARITVEEAGRRARHDALFEQAERERLRTNRNTLVALAHNRDDQAETVLLRILRGTGVRGLSAMEYRREDGLIRPLLDTSRAEIEAFCDVHELEPRWDHTNVSLEFARNRVRLELMPLLAEHFNPGIQDSLVRLADHAREDDRTLQALALALVSESQAVRMPADTVVALSFPIERLIEAGPAVGKRIVRTLFARIGLVEDIASVHLSALWQALHRSESGTVIEFPAGYRAEFVYEHVVFHPPVQGFHEMKQPAWHVEKQEIPAEEAPDPLTLPDHRALLDADVLAADGRTLRVRTRRPGDRIHPLGAPGTKKLQDWFTDAKIPRAERGHMPLVCLGSDVVWIPGRTVHEKYKVTERSRTVALLEINDKMC